MPIAAPSLLTQGDSDVPATSIVTASVSPAANRVVFATFQALETGVVPTGVSGCNLTWTQIGTGQVFAGDLDIAVAVWWGVGASPSSGAITATYAVEQTRFSWTVQQWGTDVNPSTPVAQHNKNTAASGTSGSATLSSSVTAGNALFAAVGHRAVEATSPGAGFAELTDFADTWAGHETEWEQSPADNIGGASWASDVSWGIILVEVAAAATAPSIAFFTRWRA